MTERPLTPECAACDDDLSAWIDGELAERRAHDVSRHVAACDRCRSRLEGLHAVDGALRALSEAPLTNREAAGLERVRARLETSREERGAEALRDRPAGVVASIGSPRTETARRRRRPLLTTSVAAVAAALALGVLVVPALLERALSDAPGLPEAVVQREMPVAGEVTARRPAQPIAPGRAARVELPKASTPGHLGASAPADPVADPVEDRVAQAADFDAADLPLVERLDALEALPRVRDLPEAERRRLAGRLDPLGSAAGSDREQLGDNVERWRTTPAPQREALRQRWRSFQALAPAERNRLLDIGAPAP